MKIISIVWFLCVLAFLVADVRTGDLKRKDVEPLRCYNCPRVGNTTDCSRMLPVRCTPEQPYCGTTADSPDYTTSLGCTAETGEQTPCALTLTTKDTYQISCTCDDHLCNKPFTPAFRNELLNLSPTYFPDNSTVALLNIFINSSAFCNVTSANLYEAITQSTRATPIPPAPPSLTSSSTMVPNISNNVIAPRVEALKQEATVPSDDDEDESEGSGSFEDAKPQPPAAPAAPSSFLPANENKAYRVHINVLAALLFISLCTVA